MAIPPSDKARQIEEVMDGFFTDKVRQWLDPWVTVPQRVTFSEVCTVILCLPTYQLGDVTNTTSSDITKLN